MSKEIIPSELFKHMLGQAKTQLGTKPQVTKVEDEQVTVRCQGGKDVSVHYSLLDLKGVDLATAAAWLHGHPKLPDTIQFQVVEDHLNKLRLAQTALDAACASSGCGNGANCAVRRSAVK